jgi:regulator of RNase E activity RraB
VGERSVGKFCEAFVRVRIEKIAYESLSIIFEITQAREFAGGCGLETICMESIVHLSCCMLLSEEEKGKNETQCHFPGTWRASKM